MLSLAVVKSRRPCDGAFTLSDDDQACLEKTGKMIRQALYTFGPIPVRIFRGVSRSEVATATVLAEQLDNAEQVCLPLITDVAPHSRLYGMALEAVLAHNKADHVFTILVCNDEMADRLVRLYQSEAIHQLFKVSSN